MAHVEVVSDRSVNRAYEINNLSFSIQVVKNEL